MTTEVAPAGAQVEPAPPPASAPEAQPPLEATDQPFGVGRVEADTETTPAGPTETQEPPAPAATPPPAAAQPKAFEELSDAEKAAHPWVKDFTARQGEAVRQREERAAVQREAATRRQYAASTAFVQDFEGEIRRAAGAVDDAGNVTLDQTKVDGMFRTMLSTGAEAAVDAIGAVFAEAAGPDFKITSEEQELLTAAQHEFDRDPVKNAGAKVRQWLRMQNRAAVATETAAAREEGRRAGIAEAEARFAEQQARTAREATRQASGPTAVAPNGGPITQFDTSTHVGIGRALFDGWNPTDEELQQAEERAEANRR